MNYKILLNKQEGNMLLFSIKYSYIETLTSLLRCNTTTTKVFHKGRLYQKKSRIRQTLILSTAEVERFSVALTRDFF